MSIFAHRSLFVVESTNRILLVPDSYNDSRFVLVRTSEHGFSFHSCGKSFLYLSRNQLHHNNYPQKFPVMYVDYSLTLSAHAFDINTVSKSLPTGEHRRTHLHGLTIVKQDGKCNQGKAFRREISMTVKRPMLPAKTTVAAITVQTSGDRGILIAEQYSLQCLPLYAPGTQLLFTIVRHASINRQGLSVANTWSLKCTAA